jgi:MraZ protein
MFRGATKITLDDKGRMVIPNRYREQINELAQGRLVVTVDKDQCLLIYPLPAGCCCRPNCANSPSSSGTEC